MHGPFSRVSLAAFVILVGLLAASPSYAAPRPWYADRLAALGFQVFPSPQPMTDFSVQALDGGKILLSSLKGKVVLVNFWATWCPPCRSEMPSIQALWQKLKGRDFTIVAISLGEKPATVQAFVKQNRYDYPFFVDPSGSIGDLYGVQGIPTTYIVDGNGMAIARAVGGLEYDRPEVADLLAELSSRK
jgi:peroxiredoxin